MGLKDYIKRKHQAFKKSRAEKKVYEKQLKVKVKVARREAYTDEAVKQSQLRARIRAKQRFNPAPRQNVVRGGGISGSGMTPEARAFLFGGTPTSPAETRVKQVIRRKIRKKKRKSRPKVRSVVQRVKQQAQAKPSFDADKFIAGLPQ